MVELRGSFNRDVLEGDGLSSYIVVSHGIVYLESRYISKPRGVYLNADCVAFWCIFLFFCEMLKSIADGEAVQWREQKFDMLELLSVSPRGSSECVRLSCRGSILQS